MSLQVVFGNPSAKMKHKGRHSVAKRARKKIHKARRKHARKAARKAKNPYAFTFKKTPPYGGKATVKRGRHVLPFAADLSTIRGEIERAENQIEKHKLMAKRGKGYLKPAQLKGYKGRIAKLKKAYANAQKEQRLGLEEAREYKAAGWQTKVRKVSVKKRKTKKEASKVAKKKRKKAKRKVHKAKKAHKVKRHKRKATKRRKSRKSHARKARTHKKRHARKARAKKVRVRVSKRKHKITVTAPEQGISVSSSYKRKGKRHRSKVRLGKKRSRSMKAKRVRVSVLKNPIGGAKMLGKKFVEGLRGGFSNHEIAGLLIAAPASGLLRGGLLKVPVVSKGVSVVESLPVVGPAAFPIVLGALLDATLGHKHKMIEALAKGLVATGLIQAGQSISRMLPLPAPVAGYPLDFSNIGQAPLDFNTGAVVEDSGFGAIVDASQAAQMGAYVDAAQASAMGSQDSAGI